MTIYYILFILTYVITMFGAYANKKYQITAGTGLFATSVYMIINGIVSALVSIAALIASGESFEITMYSLISALATVICAAISTVGTFKAYERGQMSVVTTFTAIGSIIMSCAWGLIFLKERLTIRQTAAISLMVIAVLIVLIQKNTRVDKSILGLLLLTIVTSGLVSILGKQHQVEMNYSTVNTMCYSVWVGIIRAIVFSIVLCYLIFKKQKEDLHLSKTVLGSAGAASVFSGLSYILSLIVLKVLPLTIVSTFGTALNIFLTAIMAWIAYKEKMTKKQIIGIVLCIVGIFLFTGAK